MKFTINKCLNRILAPCCNLCRTRLTNGNLCNTCENSIFKTTPCCPTCQISLENSETCGACLHLQPRFDQAFVLGDYANSLETLITGLKFKGKLAYGKSLSDLFLKSLPKWYHDQPFPELLIPVPLHTKRLKKRGFNQALEIAKPIAKACNLSLDRLSCVRQKATDSQMTLPKTLRKQNVAQAFRLKKNLQAKHIAILDDVMTTGYTLDTLAKCLKKNGAKRIDVWCCARTQLDRNT